MEEKYRIDENTSGVFVSPNKQMIVAGGFKNPKFKIAGETVNGMIGIIKDIFEEKEIQSREELY